MDMPAGSFIMPFNTILDLVSAIGSQFVSSGLVQLDLHSDGLFAAKYHEVVVEEGADIMTTIFSPTFAEAVSVFPSAETAAVLPEGALSFYTESNLLFAASARISSGRSRSRRGWRFFPRSTRCSALIRG